MALAYAVILVAADLYDHHKRDAVQQAQQEADRTFEKLARKEMKGTVTRNPEPRVMTYPEMRNAWPYMNLDGLVGLYFTADIA